MKPELIQKLTQWGCDTDGALKRLGGDEELYTECVCQVSSQLSALPELASAIKEGDAKRGFEIAHYLKGAVANVGLTPVLTPLSALTEIFRGGSVEGSTAFFDELEGQCKQLHSLI